MADILERVKKVISERFDIDQSKITPEASFMTDLGFDSLDTYDVIFDIEEEFNIKIGDDEKANEIETVGDLINYLKELGVS